LKDAISTPVDRLILEFWNNPEIRRAYLEAPANRKLFGLGLCARRKNIDQLNAEQWRPQRHKSLIDTNIDEQLLNGWQESL
jgi:hypothetical protein